MIMDQEDRVIDISTNLELSESKYDIKFCCKMCNICIKYADIRKHQLKCIIYCNKNKKKIN